MGGVLHLHPVLQWPAAIGAVAALAHQSLEPELADRPAIDAAFVRLVEAHFHEFYVALERVIDALVLVRHGRDRSRLSKAAADDIADEARDLAWEYQDVDEDDIAARYRGKDTTKLLACLRRCNDICLKAADSYCAMSERH